MMRNSRYIALVIVLCLIPDLVRYTERMLRGFPNREQGTQRYILLGVASMILLGVALLTWLPCAKRRISVRCWEAFWMVAQVLAVYSVLVEAVEDVEGTYRCDGKVHGRAHWPDAPDEQCLERLCSKDRLSISLKVALTLDAFVTVAHLVLPIRWAIMFLLDVLIVVFYVVLTRTAGKYDNPIYLPVLVFMLVSGSSLGLRQQERHERDTFQLLTDERVLRAKAEFASQNGLSSVLGRSTDHRDATTEIVSARSVPTTTLTGRLFSSVTQQSGAAQLDVLQSLLKAGVQEGWMIREDELEINTSRPLGQGSFGVVVEGKFCCGLVAIKYPRKTMLSINHRISFFNELRILRHIRHPCIALFHGACFSGGGIDITLVMEKVHGVTLLMWAAQQKPPTLGILEGRECIMQSLCHALVYLHSRRPCVVHADLKPTNVMVEMMAAHPRPKLLDFGVSRLMTRTAVLAGGSLDYMAPEVRSNPDAKPSPAIDIFAFGKLFVCMTTAKGQGASESDTRIVEETLLKKWERVITMCSDDDSLNRPTAASVHAELWGDAASATYEPLMSTSSSQMMLRMAEKLSSENNTVAPPSSLLSRNLQQVTVELCSAEVLAELLSSRGGPHFRGTVSAAVQLCLKHARGPALVLIAEREAFRSVLCDEEDGEDGEAMAMMEFRTTDGGYMSERLRNIHVSDPRFAETFRDFTDSAGAGYWPEDYPDPFARKLRKDGAFVLDTSGYRIKCSALTLGISPPAVIPGKISTMHNAALACASNVCGCIALVRDSDGSIDAVMEGEGGLIVYRAEPLSSHATQVGRGLCL